MHPLISVSMPILNPNAAFFCESVHSILSQTCESIELLIVEDPSDFRVETVLAEYRDARIRHMVNPSRTSLIEQRNRAWQEANAEYVALLDGDDIAEPERLQRQVEFLQANPQIAVVGSDLRIIDDAGVTLGFRSYPTEHEDIVSAMPRFNPIAQPSVMFRRSAVMEVDGYTYRKYPVCSDYDLWSRLVLAGVRFANLAEPLTRYRIHRGSLKTTKLRDSLRATLDIKRTYWSEKMNVRARMRMWAERMLLWLPPSVTMAIFKRMQFQRRR